MSVEHIRWSGLSQSVGSYISLTVGVADVKVCVALTGDMPSLPADSSMAASSAQRSR